MKRFIEGAPRFAFPPDRVNDQAATGTLTGRIEGDVFEAGMGSRSSQAASAAPTGERLPRILLVEDEPQQARHYGRTLRRHAEVITASTAGEALGLLERGEPFDALVIDLLLPDGCGWDVLALARKRLPTALALVITGAIEIAHINRAYSMDAALLEKPIDDEWLRRLARRAAEGEQAAREALAARARVSRGLVGSPVATLADPISKLRELLAVRQDWRTRYQVGSIIKQLKAHPERFGVHAVREAANATAQDPVALYRCARVAERWTAPEVEAIIATPMSNGTNLSWRHLTALAAVGRDSVRGALLRRALDESLSAHALENAVAAEERLADED